VNNELQLQLQLQSYTYRLNGFLFVLLRLYLIQIHISEPMGQHMTSPPPPNSVTFSTFLRPSSDIFPLPNDYTDLPAHTVTCVSASPTRVYTRPSPGRFSTCFILSARSHVCVHRHVVTYSGHFLLRYSHGTFFCNLLNALRRLRPITCVFVCLKTPAWLHLPDISIFATATHSFSHICTLSNTPLLLMLSLSLL